MAIHFAVINDTTGKISRGDVYSVSGISGGSFVDEFFEVSSVGGQTTFSVTTPFTVSTKIDVYVNGMLLEEAVDKDYERNVSGNSIGFKFTVSYKSRVRVRIWG